MPLCRKALFPKEVGQAKDPLTEFLIGENPIVTANGLFVGVGRNRPQ